MTNIDILQIICLFIAITGIICISFGYVEGIYMFWVFGVLFVILRGYEVFFK